MLYFGKLFGLNEIFFRYYEEVDFYYHTKQTGWRVAFLPKSVVKHLGGSSSKQIIAGA